MTATQELLVYVFMARAAISGGQLGRNDEALVVVLLLTCNRLMTIQTIHAFPRVKAHLVLMNDRVLSSEMTFRAFPAGADEVGIRLFSFDFWSGAIDEERGQYESKGDDYAQEDGPKRHETSR
jgi:hypothetical protein